MKKIKFGFLLSIICMLFSTLSHGQISDTVIVQPIPPIVVTRSDVNGTFSGAVTLTLRRPLGSLYMGLGTHSLTNGTTTNFSGPYSNSISFRVSDGVSTSAYLPIPTDAVTQNPQDVVFNYGTYTIHIAIWRTGGNTFTLSAVRAVPID